jgi:hypothetical protein
LHGISLLYFLPPRAPLGHEQLGLVLDPDAHTRRELVAERLEAEWQRPQRNKLQIYSLELFQCFSVSSVANEYTVAKILNVRYSLKIPHFGRPAAPAHSEASGLQKSNEQLITQQS